MTYTAVPAVVAGTKIAATWGNAASTAAGELQVAYPQAISTWTSPVTGGVTIGNGTNTGFYTKQGGVIHAFSFFQLGTTSAITGDIILTLPATALSQFYFEGYGYFYDVGTNRFPAFVFANSTTQIIMRPQTTAGANVGSGTAASATNPMTWATSDIFACAVRYPV